MVISQLGCWHRSACIHICPASACSDSYLCLFLPYSDGGPGGSQITAYSSSSSTSSSSGLSDSDDEGGDISSLVPADCQVVYLPNGSMTLIPLTTGEYQFGMSEDLRGDPELLVTGPYRLDVPGYSTAQGLSSQQLRRMHSKRQIVSECASKVLFPLTQVMRILSPTILTIENASVPALCMWRGQIFQ
jgi:hypothetical protein